MGDPEKTNAKKLTDELEAALEVWYQRITDAMTGASGYRKPFDGILTIVGIAIEWKFQDGGLTFPLDEWRKERWNQEIGLRQFTDSGAGRGILAILWKRKRRINLKWAFVEELLGLDKIEFDNEILKGKKELVKLIMELKNA